MRQALLRPALRFMVLALASGVAASLGAQAARVPGTVVIATGGDPTLPIPYVGPPTSQNADVADQLFLRFGVLRPTVRTTGDDALLPMLAKSWKRTDSLTLVFELDPRARWHDGAPVTAHDAAFTWSIAQNPKINNNLPDIESLAAVEEIGPRTVRVRFKRAFAEQLFRFAFGFQPLPSHLLEKLAPEAIATSDFATHPIGNGPYRWARRVPGQLVELRADSTFFAGRPAISRVMFRVAPDAAARLNLLLSGDLDVMDNIPAVNLPQVAALPDMRMVRVASNVLAYALFNARSATDPGAPNRFFADVRVREAMTLALDRAAMASNVFGAGTAVPDAAQSLLWSWMSGGTIRGASANSARARVLLAAAGWRDSDGDGVLDKGGAPFRIVVIYNEQSANRTKLAIQSQAAWKAVGVQADLQPSPGSKWFDMHNKGQFDVDFTGANQDASPSSLIEAWSCTSSNLPGSLNVAHWCDPTFDRLVRAAVTSRGAAGNWRAVLDRMANQHPAAFLAAPPPVAAVHTRLDNALIMPVRQWLYLWQWHIRPGAAIARDR